MVLCNFHCPSDSDAVAKLMLNKLTKQARNCHVGPALVNTTRVVLHEPPQFKTEMVALVFAIGELLQNPVDQMKDALLDERCKLFHAIDSSCLTWKIVGCVVMQIDVDSNGFDVEELCLPLSLDCIGSGTGQKPTSTQAAASANDPDDCGDDGFGTSEAGGFGDGSKTAFHALLYYGYSCQYIFLCFDASDMDRVIVWDWVVRVFDGFSEPHMAVEVTVRARTACEKQREHRPTMITRVRKTDRTTGSDQLQHALVAALCRFECIMYKRVPDPLKRSIFSQTHGSWVHRCTFEPLVDKFIGIPIALPSDYNTCLVLVSGIIYKFSTFFAPSNLVICIVGKGIPGSRFSVFNNQMREVDTDKLKSVFGKQFRDFHSYKSNTDALTSALLPLLKGGASLLYQKYRSALLDDLLYDESSKQALRKMLLFKRLSPRTWGPNEAQQRKLVQKRVDDAILVTDYNSERARWYQFLCNKCDNVVVVDPLVANAQLFLPVAIDEMEREASRLALANANGRKNMCVLAPREVRTAIKYIAGKESDVKVVRVFQDPGDGIQSYDFRFTTPTSDIIVIYQPVLDTESLVGALGPHMRASTEETGRAMQFSLHFHGNALLCLAMSERIKRAVACATKLLPYDIGEDRKRPRDDDDSCQSDLSDSEENPLNQFTELVFKVDADKQHLKRSVSNQPRVKVPPNHLKSISRHRAGVGGGTSAGPARDIDDIDSCALAWNNELGIFQPANEPTTICATLITDIATFHRCVDMVRGKVDVGRCQVFPCYAPGETWKGYHRHDGVCMINLALVRSAASIIGTTLHEVGHEESSYHDINHGRAMQRRFEEFISHVLPFS